MNALAFKVTRKNGEYVKPTLLPSPRNPAPAFGLLDGIMAGVCLGGLVVLISLLLRG
ncbi:MAG TPA: hypothetical protein PKN95_03950 [Verrucomicrobiota bacterium]|nr:hypothetical protein [Verrucomicrobiota bacterium]HNT13640.1 hypothetical protein [Verrucomicrobiota bacterium]